MQIAANSRKEPRVTDAAVDTNGGNAQEVEALTAGPDRLGKLRNSLVGKMLTPTCDSEYASGQRWSQAVA